MDDVFVAGELEHLHAMLGTDKAIECTAIVPKPL
jgi:hypothetical protein